MIIIGADLSLSSSALCVFKDDKLIFKNYTNKNGNYKWIKNTSHLIDYTFHNFENDNNYTESEIYKLKKYDEITEKIKNDVINIIGVDEQVKIFIEGYAFSANGKLIDIIAFSTLLRVKLLNLTNTEITIVSPSSLKSFIGSEVYDKDKRGIYRNENGKAAGSFDKKDIMEALLKLKLDFPYMYYLKANKEILLSTKNLPKPFDDTSDAASLMYYGCKQNNIVI